MACGLADVRSCVTVGMDVVGLTSRLPLRSSRASGPLDRRNGPPCPDEGFDVPIGALARGRGRLPGRRPMIIGAGPASGGPHARVARLGLVGRAVLAKHLGSAHPALRGAALVVLSSRSGEVGGIIRLEAMARGMPAIAADRGSGPGDLLGDGRRGLLVSNEDAAALSRVVAARIAGPAGPCARARRGSDRAGKFSTEWWTDGLRIPPTPLVRGRR